MNASSAALAFALSASGVITVNYLEKGFQGYSAEMEHIETAISENNPWLQLFLTWNFSFPFDKEVLQKYVHRITLDHMRIASIEFSHAEWFMALPEEWRG